MPRVLRIINRLNLGGPTYNVAYLTAGLAPEFETMLVAGMKDDSEESSEFIVRNMGIEPVYIRNMQREISFAKDRDAYRQLTAIIHDFKPDIVHTHAAKAGTLGRLAAIHLKVPVVLHTFHGHVFHSYFSPLKTKLFVGIERYLAQRSSGIIAISEDQKHDLGTVFKICDPSKIKVIPLGFDLDRFGTDMEVKRQAFRSTYKLDDDTLAIGIIGRLVPVKNHPYFLDVWKRVKAATSRKIHAFIIGDGEDRLAIEQLCNDLNIPFSTPEKYRADANLTFTSWIKDIDRALAGLDIITLTSKNEGTPVSLIEAQAAGKPIVTTAVGGIGNAVIPGVTAFLAEPDDSEGFAAHLLKIVTDDSLRNAMCAAGPAFARSNYHCDRLVSDMRGYYKELLSR